MSDDAKLWGGRFQGGVDPAIHRFTEALSFDRRLAHWDLVGSLAHARMLMEEGILSREDGVAILEGLAGMLEDLGSGELVVEGPDEDTHSWIERVLGERIGQPAGKLHTARSRNDQTGTCLRLYVRAAVLGLHSEVRSLQRELLERASSHGETWMPGYTHLQRGSREPRSPSAGPLLGAGGRR